MIYFYTGTPGAGKTLFTIDEVLTQTGIREKLKKGKPNNSAPWFGRPVYYHHITGLDESLTGWINLSDPTDWQSMPKGSILVIDETHKFFPKVGKGVVPRYVEDLSEHRHSGYDIFFITQNPMMVNHHIRGLVDTHVHFERQQGWEQNTAYKWNRLGKPNDYHDMKIAEKKRNRFSKVKYVYSLYKSADVHTSKKTIPPMLYIGLALVLFLFYLGYRLNDTFGSGSSPVLDIPSQTIQENTIPVNSSSQVYKASFDSSDSVVSRYNQHFHTDTIIKNYYPSFVVNSIQVFKTELIKGYVYYEFKNNNDSFILSKSELQDYSIKVDTTSRCRDALYLPEMSTILYTICTPRKVYNYSLLASSQGSSTRIIKSKKNRYRSSNNRPVTQSTTQSIKETSPNIPVNPFSSVFN